MRLVIALRFLVVIRPRARFPEPIRARLHGTSLGIGATGGGFSVLYDEPSYSARNDTAGGKQRGVPDVSYTAAVLHGVLLYVNIPGPTGWLLSHRRHQMLGSPQWAAILSIADQEAGYDLGFVNKALYHIGQAPPHYSVSFFDVTSGNNSFDGVTGFNAGHRAGTPYNRSRFPQGPINSSIT